METPGLEPGSTSSLRRSTRLTFFCCSAIELHSQVRRVALDLNSNASDGPLSIARVHGGMTSALYDIFQRTSLAQT